MFNETTFVILAATAAIGYGISFIFGIAKRQRPAIGVFIAAWVLNLLTIIGNYVVSTGITTLPTNNIDSRQLPKTKY